MRVPSLLRSMIGGMIALLLVLPILSMTTTSVAAKASFTSCGVASDLLRITTITVTPDPPSRTKPWTLTVAYAPRIPVTVATIHEQAWWGIVKVKDDTLAGSSIQTKSPVGTLALTFPGFTIVPPGITVALKLNLYNASNKELTCIQASGIKFAP